MSSLTIPEKLNEYLDLWGWIKSLKDRNRMDEWEFAMRHYCLKDLFFLINFVGTDGKTLHSSTKKPLFFHDFYLEFCKQNQYYIDNNISSFDGSARRGGKSTVRTKWCTIQQVLRNPNISIGIFSVLKSLAKKHVSVIKDELQDNLLLKTLFADVLYEDPQMSAKNGETIWSLTEGLRVKRTRIRSTQTIEHGQFYGNRPTGSGYDIIHFDDCENEAVVSTQENLTKLYESYNAAAALATPSELEYPVFYVTNTFYHPEGIARRKYKQYLAQDESSARIRPGEDLSIPGDGPLGGTPVYPFTLDILRQKYSEMGKDDYAIQICCNFTIGQDRTFNRSWIGFYNENPKDMMRGKNSYICIDASKGVYDPMGIWVWSIGQDKKLYWTDGRRKKLDPASPAFFDEIFNICMTTQNFSDRLVELRVEQMNQQTWAELIGSELNKRGVYVKIVPCKGKMDKGKSRNFGVAKLDREWQRWAPALQRGDVVFPKPSSMGGSGLMTTDENGNPFDLVDYFLQSEYDMFPRAPHDDLLDAGDLIWEPEVGPIEYPSLGYKKYRPTFNNSTSMYGWMSAG